MEVLNSRSRVLNSSNQLQKIHAKDFFRSNDETVFSLFFRDVKANRLQTAVETANEEPDPLKLTRMLFC